MELVKFSILECSQTKGIQPKIRGNKLRSCVCWQGMLEQKGIKRRFCVCSMFGLTIILLNGLWYHYHEVIKLIKT
jgi:hypothetical protein